MGPIWLPWVLKGTLGWVGPRRGVQQSKCKSLFKVPQWLFFEAPGLNDGRRLAAHQASCVFLLPSKQFMCRQPGRYGRKLVSLSLAVCTRPLFTAWCGQVIEGLLWRNSGYNGNGRISLLFALPSGGSELANNLCLISANRFYLVISTSRWTPWWNISHNFS